jgi:ubiquinone/menaquinone biosynthesis C-methylase UbiE
MFCASWALNVQSAEGDSVTINYNNAAGKYAANRRLHAGVFQDLLTTGQVSADKRVLEVGCGTGNYDIALQESTRCEAWGIDPSEGMLAKAVERGSAVRFGPGAGEAIPFEAQSFHLVFSVDVIHHMQDRPAYFGEALRVLKPGGRICTVTDSEEIIRNRPLLSKYFPETVEVELQRYPPVPDLRRLMEEAGFHCIHEAVVETRSEVDSLQAFRDKAFSSLHLISEEAFQRGLQKLGADLAKGPILNISRYVCIWGTRNK